MSSSSSSSSKAANNYPAFPNLPLLRLDDTAEETTTVDVVAASGGRRRYTVIDFWTTKCTRCPAALDALDDRARKHSAAGDGGDGSGNGNIINFASICCDSCDGAREIIDRDAMPRWGQIEHFFMSHDDKEVAKQVLGFRSVPFYVVVENNNRCSGGGGGGACEIVQMGKKIDWEALELHDSDGNGKENSHRQQYPAALTATTTAFGTSSNRANAVITLEGKEEAETGSLTCRQEVAAAAPATDFDEAFVIEDLDF